MTSSAAQLKFDYSYIAEIERISDLDSCPEIEYYQKLSSHAQIGPQGAENQQMKVFVVGGGGGGGWWVVVGMK